MTSSFYKLKRHRLVSGVLAGLADKFGLSVTLLRFLFILFTVSHAFIGVIIYLLLDTRPCLIRTRRSRKCLTMALDLVEEKRPNPSMIRMIVHFSKRRFE